MKKFLGILLIGLLVLTGCSTKKDDDTGDTTDVERPYYVRDEGEITGTITVYTTMEETQQDALKALWTKYYPESKLEIQADSVGTLATRIRGDGQSDADVIIGGLFAADGDIYHDILQPYRPQNEKELAYTDDAGYYTFFDVQIMSLVVNPALRDELGVEINGYEDLLNPALKGKIATADPASSSSAFAQLTNMLLAKGGYESDEAWSYVEKMIQQWDGKIQSGSSGVYKSVVDGEMYVGLTYEDPVSKLVKDGAKNIEIVYPEEGTVFLPAGTGIVKGAKNLENAKKFVDFLLSEEVQEIFGTELTNRAVRKDVQSGAHMKPFKDIKLIFEDMEYVTKNKEAIVERYTNLFAKNQ